MGLEQLEVKIDCFEQDIEILGKKRITSLEPEPEEEIIDTFSKPKSGFIENDPSYPEEEIIDTSSKPKSGLIGDDYPELKIKDLEEFVDTWDLEDTE